MDAAAVLELFQQYNADLERLADVKDSIQSKVRELDVVLQTMESRLGQMHHGVSELAAVATSVLQSTPQLRQAWQAVYASVPDGDFFRFCGMWRNSVARTVSCFALATWLLEDRLVLKEELESGVGLQLEPEQYLLGLANTSSDLSRLCVNSVIAGRMDLPHRISKFIHHLFDGFRLLNLKNDILRKRYDGMKYDVKKIEEVLYDMAVRGLTPPEQASNAQ